MVSLNLRLKDEDHKKITKIAEFQNRSLNKQIEHIIQQHIREFEKINGEIKKD